MEIYEHKLTGQRCTIKSINGEIVTCNLIDEQNIFNVKGESVHPVVITNINNLQLCN